jgi:signal transduction histidine kinase
MSSSDTKFAPAERANTRSILRDAEALKETGLIEHIIHVIPSILMVLNHQRQIVYKNQQDAYEFRVWALPYTYDGTDYTIFSLQDIGDEKRREVLERTLFHDVNNSLYVIAALSELAARAENKEDFVQFSENIQLATRELAAEIASHTKLLQAEQGDLSVELEGVFSAGALVDELVHTFSRARPDGSVAKGKECDDFGIITDRTLLRRVLSNMIKNAIEASSPSEVVSIRCIQEESSGVFSVHNSGFMPRSTQLQVFQQSFSTKGKGRGIGTYSMKLFGEKYLKGKVWFSTSEDRGTTFFISVPLSYEDA